MEWHSRGVDEVLNEVGGSRKGLSEGEVQKRYGKYGKNVIKKEKSWGKFALFFKQFNSLILIILVLAAVLSGVLGHLIDAFVIGFIVILNAIIGFVQEYKAGEIIEKLRKSLQYKVVVLRNGSQKEIDSQFLVPGDIIVLNEGDKILSDSRIIKSENLQLNESVLTGESFPVSKKNVVLQKNVSLSDRKNMLYTGTTISSGKALAVVVNTGNNTEFGKLATLVQKTKEEKMPLEKKLDSFSRNLSIAILVIVAFMFAIGISSGIEIFEMFLLSISLAVSAIPEGLPAIIAITLAVAIKQMHKVNTLIRKLPAAETLGRATVICTDKTGTITEEELRVDKLYSNSKMYSIDNKKDYKKFSKALLVSLLCNNARDEADNIIGDPTGAALVGWGKKYGINKKDLTEKNPRIKEYPFTSERKMMSIIRGKGKIKTSYVKGAADIILDKCTKELIGNKIKLISKTRKRELHEIHKKMEASGLRVLGLAFKKVTKISQSEAENHLIFSGFVGMIDPPRSEVKEAIKEAMDAGIKIKIITGDSALTTKAIAKKIGLEGEIIEGKELSEIPDQKWDSLVRTKTIFARVTPEQKLRIVESLKRQAETVAVTGDGVNDILALKKADIGVSMGIRGSDVARDSSDIVLLDDNFASIVKAIKQGRRVFDNIKKSLKFLLATNGGELLILALALLIGLPIPFLPLAILWINLVTESLPALALAVEKASPDIMHQKPLNKGLLHGVWQWAGAGAIMNLIAGFSIFIWALNNYNLEIARTMLVTTIVSFELFYSFACRSKESLFKIGFFSNKWLNGAVILSAAIHLFAVYTPPIGSLIGVVPLTLSQLGLVVLVSTLGLIFFEIWKLFKK